MLVVGMSQGGRVALHFARAHPGLMSGLVLDGAPLDGFQPGPRPDETIPLDRFAALARAGELARMKALWRAHPLMHAGSAAMERALDPILADYEARDLIAAAPREMTPLAGDLAGIAVPALVITGEHDTRWRQLVGDALAYGLPDSRRAVIAGGHHLCNLSHPADYNAMLAGFAREVAGA